MLVWTIQSLQVWETLQQDGFLDGPGPDLISRVTESWQWQTAYQWMAEQFETKLAVCGLTYIPLEPLSDPVFHQRILDSWQRIFELEGVGDPDWLGKQTRDEKAIQATFWQLSLNQIREVTVFTSRQSGLISQTLA
ncbi:hypothetical protein [Ktedonobacter racemifer]|uniref:Uncharacterized protein n=1 Tax=Ktedonobacter racemifer DSM 44963 TaxID=485913 RepID=D6U368_KTERA|nr:hypothetical protein [Ktedonobacter racemifer]EFH81072.1 hypothetical protein Krac_1747 [Ktedonobacter racemifer DSM 44963]